MNIFINEALKEAKLAKIKNEIPIGCVLVMNNKIIARAHNTRERENNLLGHAEINAIILATKKLRTWKLNDCEIYVTLEPCLMCYGVIKQARIKKIYYGMKSQKKEGYSNFITNDLDIEVEYSENLKINKIMQEFFQKLRL